MKGARLLEQALCFIITPCRLMELGHLKLQFSPSNSQQSIPLRILRVMFGCRHKSPSSALRPDSQNDGRITCRASHRCSFLEGLSSSFWSALALRHDNLGSSNKCQSL